MRNRYNKFCLALLRFFLKATATSGDESFILARENCDDSNIKTKNAINILNNCNSDLFPNVSKLLQILVTLPVTSCEAERSFSPLKRIKTYLRNSTSESRLNGLAALNIHYDIDVKSEEVIQRLSNLKRRLDFIL
ncbi:unnamed protein product [Macrosiphum euphorbiae]|uniref:HAT C-terminal dimerisation domain-containing protein n=1 Tax=Macrosiphum euphorbiae TaxID=13131 RepID=A0AAV0VZA6_9HEMI|nr:unnamed protein product [Macrosiphum euphorbiae]